MSKSQVNKVKKQKKREKRIGQRKGSGLKNEITRDDRSFGKLQLIILGIFILVFLGFIISKIQ
ncbi:MAG: hypothetical protein OEY33_05905 [Bdellovibrionales bacterium]|nr:hypothetical protein [Bdellovibrionales bacterium]